MVQLRDSQTSELIGAVEPAAAVLLSQRLGDNEVLYDDVGTIDPPALLTAYEAEVALAVTSGDQAAIARSRAALRNADASESEVRSALVKARARLRRGGR